MLTNELTGLLSDDPTTVEEHAVFTALVKTPYATGADLENFVNWV